MVCYSHLFKNFPQFVVIHTVKRFCVINKAVDIKKRWQEYTEELYKKDLHDPDYHDGVTTHLEPDILECKVK